MFELFYHIDLKYILLALCLIHFVVVELSFRAGGFYQKKYKRDQKLFTDFTPTTILGLLALILGFTFSMAISRYEVRKNLVIKQANVISTTDTRMELMPASQAKKMRGLLRQYLTDLIGRLETRNYEPNLSINQEMWTAVKDSIQQDRGPIGASLLVTFNEMLDTTGEINFAARDHVPESVFFLILFISILGISSLSFLSGAEKSRHFSLYILALLFSVTITFIADIDRPVRGMIRVDIQTLRDLSQQLGKL